MTKDDTPVMLSNPVDPTPIHPTSTTSTETNPKSDTPVPTPPIDAPRVVNKIVISGKPAWEYWTQMFNGFVNRLKNNHLEIEQTFTANVHPNASHYRHLGHIS